MDRKLKQRMVVRWCAMYLKYDRVYPFRSGGIPCGESGGEGQWVSTTSLSSVAVHRRLNVVADLPSVLLTSILDG